MSKSGPKDVAVALVKTVRSKQSERFLHCYPAESLGPLASMLILVWAVSVLFTVLRLRSDSVFFLGALLFKI
jgi:hypothetical protein